MPESTHQPDPSPVSSTPAPVRSAKGPASSVLGLVKVGGLAVAVFLAAMYARSMFFTPRGLAATPAAFGAEASLAGAFQAAGEGPVLALVTADWCPPCQALKRGALADPRFAQWVVDNEVVTAYLDATDFNADADALGVRSLPTLVYLEDGREVARSVGVKSASQVIGWLDGARQQ